MEERTRGWEDLQGDGGTLLSFSQVLSKTSGMLSSMRKKK
ncbi:hypothetical protein LEMLEM_LOCUS15918 [Lemmus lemmus]